MMIFHCVVVSCRRPVALALWSALYRAAPTLYVNDAEELSAGLGGNSTSSSGAQALDKHINRVTLSAGS